MIHQVGTLSHPFFLARFAGQGVLNKDLTVWQTGARPLPLVLLVLPLPENEFGKVIGKKHIGNKMIHHVGTLSHPFFQPALPAREFSIRISRFV
jgi:hypothetical protein